MSFDFDQIIDRRASRSAKWALMGRAFGVTAPDAIAMWIADMDFAPAPFLDAAMKRIIDEGHYGYFTGIEGYRDAVTWWSEARHGWKVSPDWIFSTFGLGNGIAMALQVYSDPGDHVAIFAPVYHEFSRKIRDAGRHETELPLTRQGDRYLMDFDLAEAAMTGREKILLVSSPHNPGGRVWTNEELGELADFAIRHDLIVISDEVHQDLTFPGIRHLTLHLARPELEDRLLVMSSASKTFNVAGGRTGQVVIPDAGLRARFAAFHHSLDMNPNRFGLDLTTAAYSPQGAAWCDELRAYLAGNAEVFTGAIRAIPGAAPHDMQSTYLAWVDFAGTGLDAQEVLQRIHSRARIVPTPGEGLGKGGESYMRFNLGCPRAGVVEAAARLQDAFSDLP